MSVIMTCTTYVHIKGKYAACGIHITSRLYKDSTRMASPDLPDSLLGGVVPPVSRGDLGSEVYRDRNPWSFLGTSLMTGMKLRLILLPVHTDREE